MSNENFLVKDGFDDNDETYVKIVIGLDPAPVNYGMAVIGITTKGDLKCLHVSRDSIYYTKTGKVWKVNPKGNIIESTISNMVKALLDDNRKWFDMSSVIYIEKQLSGKDKSKEDNKWGKKTYAGSQNFSNRNTINIEISTCSILTERYPNKIVRVISPASWKRDAKLDVVSAKSTGSESKAYKKRKNISVEKLLNMVGADVCNKWKKKSGKVDDIADAFHIAMYALKDNIKGVVYPYTQIEEWHPNNSRDVKDAMYKHHISKGKITKKTVKPVKPTKPTKPTKPATKNVKKTIKSTKNIKKPRKIKTSKYFDKK